VEHHAPSVRVLVIDVSHQNGGVGFAILSNQNVLFDDMNRSILVHDLMQQGQSKFHTRFAIENLFPTATDLLHAVERALQWANAGDGVVTRSHVHHCVDVCLFEGGVERTLCLVGTGEHGGYPNQYMVGGSLGECSVG